MARGPERFSDRVLAALHAATADEAVQRLDQLSRDTGEQAASALIRLLSGIDFTEPDARSLVAAAFKQRISLEARTGRSIHVRIALFDLLVNVERKLTNPRIIELPAFEKLERSAIYDHLTGTCNRAYFEGRLSHEIRRARRYGQSLSLLLLDIDDFKAINDRMGHPVGDSVLREVGRLIVENVRDIDIAGRYGGEEFSVILPETPRTGAFIVAERIRSEFQKRYRRKGELDRALRVTVSGGLACFPEDADGPEGLVARSDEALYRSKRQGKNQITIYYEEKRRDERIIMDEKRIKATLLHESRGGPVRHTAVVKNISEGGLLVELGDPIAVGSEMEVSFSLGLKWAYKFSTTVVRVEEFGASGKRRRFALGLRFPRRMKQLQPHLSRLARRQAAAG
ncbi:MAG: diguanylate cyclase [Acidobacteria bacterium]|nr:diguanylate cyclase [Acidobacteriota bacterium]